MYREAEFHKSEDEASLAFLPKVSLTARRRTNSREEDNGFIEDRAPSRHFEGEAMEKTLDWAAKEVEGFSRN